MYLEKSLLVIIKEIVPGNCMLYIKNITNLTMGSTQEHISKLNLFVGDTGMNLVICS